MPGKEQGPGNPPQLPGNGEPRFTPPREPHISRPRDTISRRRDRLGEVRDATEGLRQHMKPAVEHAVGEPLAHATGDFIHGAGEVIGRVAQVEEFIEDTAEVSSEGGIVLLQRATAFGDKHIPGFATARKRIAAEIERTHTTFIEWRAQSMVEHPERLWNKIALHTMLRQTVIESTMSRTEKFEKDHPIAFQILRSPITATEITSLLPAWIPTPLRNPFLPLPIFLNQLATLAAVNARKALLGLIKVKPLEFALYSAFSILDLVLPMFNAYPISPAIDAFVSNHYHRRRRAYIRRAQQKLANEDGDAHALKEFLGPRVFRARQSASMYRGSTNYEQLQQTLRQQKTDLFAGKPIKHPKPKSEHPSLKDRLKEKPIISIPIHTIDLLRDVRRDLEILRWKGKVESVEELESLVALFLASSPEV